MATVAIVTDSTADIPLAVREELDIAMVPLKVIIGGETYLDNIELTPAQFYQKLTRSNDLAKSSQPSPSDFFETFKKLTEQGKSVVCISLSSVLSGTYQSALIAKSMLDDDADVTVIDSRSASYGYGLLVVAAAKLAREGADKTRIIEEVKRMRASMKLYFLVDTLEYLQKGGRIGKASALIGTLLNIKPILSIDDEGYVYSFEKARGQKRAFGRIAELLEEDFKGDPIELIIAKTPGFEDGLAELSGLLKSRLNIIQYTETEIGPVIGAHAGPGTLGLFATRA
ncbi:DegV family protein [Cohnella panacarvi]|uniref:DegV family protein n=1 Tax=Cohnella panacarvi TaxID=400776 RepID=UPI00047B02A9|nr:DegV family protein [Cohnella panacarvi]